jgi:hypothetical protein
MSFSDKEVEQMYNILHRLDPGITTPIQKHLSEGLTRTGFVFGVLNRKNEYTLLYRNYLNLSPYRMKLLLKLAKKIPYELQITNPKENITCIGWKY